MQMVYSWVVLVTNIHVDAVLMGFADQEHTCRCHTHGLCWSGTYKLMSYSWVVLVRNIHADAVLMSCAG